MVFLVVIMRKEVIEFMKASRIFLRSIRDAFKSVVRNFSLSFASIMCITITLILVSVAIISGVNIEKITRDIEDELTIITYLDQDVSEEDINNIKLTIEKDSNVLSVILKTKDEWKVEMSNYDDAFANVLNYMDDNPFLNTLVIKVKDVSLLKKTANMIKEIPKVNEVKYGENKVEMIISAFDVLEKVVVVIVIALILVTIFLISNTIKLTIFSRRNEIEIMRLVGASNTTIKLPFLIEGLIIGIVGAIIPICITIYGYVILYTRLNGHIISNIIKLLKPYSFVFYVSLVLLVIGAIVGMFGSIKAVKKYLKI